VVVSAPFDAVPAGLGPADRVDVYATFPGARPYTTQVGVALRVIAVTTSAGDVTGGGGGGGTSVLLDVTPDEARSLAQAMASAVLTLAVRGSAPPPSASAAPSAAPTPG
jgi:Flp pilus assembly protein CpaB